MKLSAFRLLSGKFSLLRKAGQDRALVPTGFAMALGFAVAFPVAVRADDEGAERRTQSSSVAEASATQQKYALAPGDRLSIVVFEQPDISGSYFVEPDGALTLPLLGVIQASGVSTQELQRELTRRFADGYIQNPLISVRLAELRPVTIIGAVRSPGRYTFFDGMTVEALVALAGGTARLSGEEAAFKADLLQADERLNSLKLAYLGQMVRNARLEAQLAGGEMDLPEVPEAEAAVFTKLADGEKQILDFERSSQEGQAGLLKEQVKQIGSDIATFEQQAELEKEQTEFLDNQIADLTGLVRNGLTKKSTLIEIQREKNKSRANLASILGSLTRSKSLLVETDLKLQELQTGYRGRIMADLQANRLQIAVTESLLPVAVKARQLKLDQTPVNLLEADGSPIITIRRYRGGKLETLPAGRMAEIWPGDLVQFGTGGGGSSNQAAANGLALPEPEVRRPGAVTAVPHAGLLTQR